MLRTHQISEQEPEGISSARHKTLAEELSINTQTYTLAPGVLSVSSNHAQLYGLLFGNLPAWGVSPTAAENPVCVDYLMVPDIRELYPGLAHEESARNLVYLGRKLPLGKETQLVLDWKSYQHPTLVSNKTYDWWSRTRGTTGHPLTGEVLSDMICAYLPGNGYSALHCAAVEKDGNAIVLVAASDTGKTSTAWELTQRRGFRFVCEDIGITNGKDIFGCAYTSTGLPHGVSALGPSMRIKIASKFIRVGNKPSLISKLSSDQVCPQASARALVFLRRGNASRVTELGVEEAHALLYRLNRLEFRYQADRFLLQSWNVCGEPDLDRLGQREKEILKTLVMSVDKTLVVEASDPTQFAAAVEGLV